MTFLYPSKPQSIGVAPLQQAEPVLQLRRQREIGNLKFSFNAESWEQAKDESKRSNKAILILFHETAVHHTGHSLQSVLSNSLLVETMEAYCITVLVPKRATNLAERALLKKYGICGLKKTSVVRIVDYRGRDLAGKINRCDEWNLARAMGKALVAHGLKVPTYLKLLVQELDPSAERVAVFGMSSFWEGELAFAKCKHVISTRAGWMGSKQSVEVTYNPKLCSYSKLVQHAIKENAADVIYCVNGRQMRIANSEVRRASKDSIMVGRIHPLETIRVLDADSKHYLSETALLYVPLLRVQAIKANLLISQNDAARCKAFLSPRQRSLWSEAELDESFEEYASLAA
jgi:peptide methionine sulfoxide reductase MsrA